MSEERVGAEERAAHRRDVAKFRQYAKGDVGTMTGDSYVRLGLTLTDRIERLLDALEAAERERDQAREALRLAEAAEDPMIGHGSAQREALGKARGARREAQEGADGAG